MRSKLSRLQVKWLPLLIAAVLVCGLVPVLFFYYSHASPGKYDNESQRGEVHSYRVGRATLRGGRVQVTSNSFDDKAYEEYGILSRSQRLAPKKKVFAIPDESSEETDAESDDVRVVVLIPFVGDSLPTYFDAFAQSAAHSALRFDFYIFVTESIPFRHVPSNVVMIHMTREELYKRFFSVDTYASYVSRDSSGHDKVHLHNTNAAKQKGILDEASLFDSLRRLIDIFPYMTVEYKPALDSIFSDYITPYSHWAYMDMDQLVGRLDLKFTSSILQHYDIITTSYGDNYRCYLRGQLTIHRNDEAINNLWKECTHLSQFYSRLSAFQASNYNDWKFVSAEGCYSRAVVDQRDVTVKILSMSSQLSDAFEGPLSSKESMILGDRLMRCYTQPLLHAQGGLYSAHGQQLLTSFMQNIAVKSGNNTAHTYSNTAEQLLSPSSFSRSLSRSDDYKCAYWLPREYQICLSEVASYVDLSYQEGHFSSGNQDNHLVLHSQCREGSTVHFQGWKNNFYTFNSRPAPRDSHALVVSEYGLIPLRLDAQHNHRHSEAAADIHKSILNMEYLLPSSRTYSKGQISSRELIESTHNEKLRYVTSTQSSGWHLASLMLPSHKGTTTGGEEEGNVVEGLASAYCAGFSDDLSRCMCPLLGHHISVLRVGGRLTPSYKGQLLKIVSSQRSAEIDNSNAINDGSAGEKETADAAAIHSGDDSGVDGEGVSLITVAWASDFHTPQLQTMLASWKGPKVLVLAHMGAATRTVLYGADSDTTIIEVDLSECAAYMHTNSHHHKSKKTNKGVWHADPKFTFDTDGSVSDAGNDHDGGHRNGVLPNNLLYNVGLDAAATELVCVAPVGTVFSAHILDTSTDNEGVEREQRGVSIMQQFMRSQSVSSTAYQHTSPTALVLPLFVRQQSHTANSMDNIDFRRDLREAQEGNQDLRKVISRATRDQSHHHPLKRLFHLHYNHTHPFQNTVERVAGHPVTLQHYPSTADTCASEQAAQLRLLYTDHHHYALQGTHPDVPFNALDFSHEHSTILPIVFNTSSSIHGQGFVRFPEELNGKGCFDSFILRILAGSGYALKWASDYGVYSGNGDDVKEMEKQSGTGEQRRLSMAHGSHHRHSHFKPGAKRTPHSLSPQEVQAPQPTQTMPACKCIYDNDPNALRTFIARMNAYFQRAVQLRNKGLEDVYDRTQFAGRFETEQQRLMNQ
jgi:hypothetical protein